MKEVRSTESTHRGVKITRYRMKNLVWDLSLLLAVFDGHVFVRSERIALQRFGQLAQEPGSHLERFVGDIGVRGHVQYIFPISGFSALASEFCSGVTWMSARKSGISAARRPNAKPNVISLLRTVPSSGDILHRALAFSQPEKA